jgi:hypothetical protein
VLRGLVELSCTGASLGYGFVEKKTEEKRPFLQTLLESIGVPRKEEIPVSFPTESGTCEYVEKTSK